MNEALAIVLAGIGGAVVSGVVGIVSSAISLHAARRQMENQMEEHREDRRHQVLLVILQRRHQALEAIWELLFVLESEGNLSERDTEIYVRNLFWLPTNPQRTCLQLLQNPDSRDSQSFLSARKALLDEASTIELR